MDRSISPWIREDVQEKMVLLTGPRQVGKTTLCRQLGFEFDCLDFDATQDRDLIRNETWNRDRELLILDEIHKMDGWKRWLKGIYDTEP